MRCSYKDDLEDGVAVTVLPRLALHQLVLPVLVLLREDEVLALLDKRTYQLDLRPLLNTQTHYGPSPQIYLLFHNGKVLLPIETQQLQVELLHLQNT